MTATPTRLRAASAMVLSGLLAAAGIAACTAGTATPLASPAPAVSSETPEQARAGSIGAAREAARELAGLRFTIDGAGGYTQCTDDGEYILFDITIRLRQTPTTVAAPRTPAVTTALARRGWILDPTRGSSSGTNTSTVLLRDGSTLRINEDTGDPTIVLMELTSDCFDAGDRNSTYVNRGSEIFRLT